MSKQYSALLLFVCGLKTSVLFTTSSVPCISYLFHIQVNVQLRRSASRALYPTGAGALTGLPGEQGYSVCSVPKLSVEQLTAVSRTKKESGCLLEDILSRSHRTGHKRISDGSILLAVI